MDTTGRYTRRLWIDPEDISKLLDGLVDRDDQEAAGGDKETAQLPELPVASVVPAGGEFVTREEQAAAAASPLPVSTVSPEVQERLKQRLAHIRSMATRSGAMAGRTVEGSIEVSGGAGDVEAGPRDIDSQQQAATGAVDADQESQAVFEAEGAGGATEQPFGGDASPPRGDDLSRFRERAASLEREVREGERRQVPVSPGGDAPASEDEESAVVEFRPARASLWEKFAELAEWIESQFEVDRFVLVDEHGAPIELRGIERGRFTAGGDLAGLLQRARRAIGNSETGIHLATAVGEGEYLCVVNCPSEQFPICIGLLTMERIPFRGMRAIGKALESILS